MAPDPRSLDAWIRHLTLGELLAALRDAGGGYDLVAHRTQGEFHHDVVLRVASQPLPAPVLVATTNCNGGLKELLALDDVPSHDALWHARCPDNAEFAAEPLPAVRGRARTVHWFDPCELLAPDARSELKPEHRRRQRGGGWEPAR